jgi:tetratricopeptide (TPR) repeat protein
LRDSHSHNSITLQRVFDQALCAYQNGKLVEAEKLCDSILKLSPEALPALQMKALISLTQRSFTVAVELYRRVIKADPKLPTAYLNLGIALKAQGKIELAIQNYEKAIALNPRDERSHFNRANALVQLEKFDEAIESYRTAISQNAAYTEAYVNLGNALCKTEKIQDAIDSYDMAISLDPDHADAYYNRGTALRELNRLDEALASYDKAIVFKPDYAEAYNNRGIALLELNRLDEALASYQKAIDMKPEYAEAHGSLCQLHERHNNLRELENALENAGRYCAEDNSNILFCRAQLASRKKLFEDAVGYLNRVQVQKLEPSLSAAYYTLLGKTYDNLEQFENAFSAFEKQNEQTKISVKARKFNADKYLDSILLRKKAWTTDVKPIWTNSMIGLNQTSPTFLIGFPRSGTTLLDTILRSHCEIAVVEEMPTVAVMCKAFSQAQTIQNFNTLSEADVLGLRDVYFKELRRHLDQGDENKLIVDKLPLNIGNVGIIHRVFPDAKFILVLRHPCDCVLSCFMQNFQVNDAMANFLSLDQSAKLYAAVMELWFLYRQKLDLDVHVIKYENLVQDLEGTCRSLISFLGLEWDNNLHDYQKTALDRTSINTPSYNQVIQPLYEQASGRWTNYEKQMQHVLPVLRPWIDAFDY